MTRKQWLQYFVTLIVSLAVLMLARQYVRTRAVYHYTQANYVAMKARVTDVTNVQEDSYSLSDGTEVTDRTITFNVKFLNEYRKGETASCTQSIDGYVAYTIKTVEPGDLVMIYEYHDDTGYTYAFGDYWRSDTLAWLVVLFVASVITFGRLKGVNTILGLGVTILFVFMVFVPSILAGLNIYQWSILTCLYSIVTTLLIVNGYNRKTYVAAAGCFGGVLVAGVLTAIMNSIMHISGLVDEQAMYLNDLSSGMTVDLRAVVFAAIIIGATGAVMDVAIGIASSLHELNDQVEHPTFSLLLRSGFTIGRDMMGTMANTLVLAYIGSSLSTVVLIVAYNSSVLSIFNKELIVTDMEQAVVGSLGILSAIPLTSLLSAFIYPLGHRRRRAGAAVSAGAPAGAPAGIPDEASAEAPAEVSAEEASAEASAEAAETPAGTLSKPSAGAPSAPAENPAGDGTPHPAG